METKKNDILQGTLALLILKTLAGQKCMHGYAITAHIHAVSGQLLRVEEGSLYPALHRMEQAGWVRAEWDPVLLLQPKSEGVKVATILSRTCEFPALLRREPKSRGNVQR